ncbi:MFS transporter [Pengzhenrongella phosphoraccumulans]|uniref:MFS transporter n=1 Tax=Pengzhenrongella phosphoraccumulans TaxID=3114394 RepID=UPI00388FD961
MSLAPYGRLLRRPAVLRLVLVALVARVPNASLGVIVTLHVVGPLGRGYGAAGIVAAAATIGMAIGAPWRGRLVDRLGLRRALLPSVLIEATIWTAAPFLSFEALVGAAALAGLFMVPVFSVVRQSLAVLVPPDEQRTAFALDSVCTELTFMLAPALAVLVATTWSTTAALVAVGFATVGAGGLLMWFDPPTSSAGVLAREAGRVAGRVAPSGPEVVLPAPTGRAFTPALLVVLLAAAAASLVLNGTDVSIIAALVEWDQASSAGWMIALWAGGSLVGGLAYGGGRHSIHPLVLVLALALLTIPAAFAGTPLLLAIAVVIAGVPCAPALSAITAMLVRIVPEHRRGEVMGWNGSAMTVGAALGAPLCGALIDRYGASAGFLAAGVIGAVVAGAGLVALRSFRARARARLESVVS